MKTYTLNRTSDDKFMVTEIILVIKNIVYLASDDEEARYIVKMNNNVNYSVSRTEYYDILKLIEEEQ